MTSRYNFIQFKDLKKRNPMVRNTANLSCSICKKKDQEICDCLFFSGNEEQKFDLEINGRLLWSKDMSNDYYDSKIKELLS